MRSSEFVIFSLLLLIFCHSQIVQAGGDSSGGGGSCYLKDELNTSQPILIEFSNEINNLDSSKINSLLKKVKDEEEIRLPDVMKKNLRIKTENGKKNVKINHLPIDIFKYKKLKNLLYERIEKHNSGGSAEFMSLILKVTEKLSFIGVDQEFSFNLDASLEDYPNCDPTRTKTTSIFYGPAVLLVSLPAFNRLTLWSQAGLLFHEAVRYVQILYGVNINSSDIQSITHDVFYSNEELGLDHYLPEHMSSKIKKVLSNTCLEAVDLSIEEEIECLQLEKELMLSNLSSLKYGLIDLSITQVDSGLYNYIMYLEVENKNAPFYLRDITEKEIQLKTREYILSSQVEAVLNLDRVFLEIFSSQPK